MALNRRGASRQGVLNRLFMPGLLVLDLGELSSEAGTVRCLLTKTLRWRPAPRSLDDDVALELPLAEQEPEELWQGAAGRIRKLEVLIRPRRNSQAKLA